MALSFRKMRVGDVPAVFEVRLSTVENAVTADELEHTYGVTPRSLAEAMRFHVEGWVCEHDGAVVGFAMGDRSSGEVLVVAVRPEHEGRGIGGELLTRVEDRLFAAGRDEIWLRVTPDPTLRASGFYRKRGWRASGVLMGADEVMKLRKPRG